MKFVRRISEPVPGGPWRREMTCWKCRIVWLVEENDLHVINTAVISAGENWEPEIVFVCDECHSNVLASGVPSEIGFRLINDERRRLWERSQG